MKHLAKLLLLAQTASNAGKGCSEISSSNCEKAVSKGYGLKDTYIRQAISEAKKCRKAHVSVTHDMYMRVVIFDLEGFGQMSFHSFADYAAFVKSEGRGWNGVRGGSELTAKKLARKFNLPHYKKGKNGL